MANGFALEVRHVRQIQILVEAGGWSHVRDEFLKSHQNSMRRFPERRIVLLLDFDNNGSRRSEIENKVSPDLKERVFLIGVKSNPEGLKQAGLGTFEEIGRLLAVECRDELRDLWRHRLLQDNLTELERLRTSVRPFLFQAD